MRVVPFQHYKNFTEQIPLFDDSIQANHENKQPNEQSDSNKNHRSMNVHSGRNPLASVLSAVPF